MDSDDGDGFRLLDLYKPSYRRILRNAVQLSARLEPMGNIRMGIYSKFRTSVGAVSRLHIYNFGCQE